MGRKVTFVGGLLDGQTRFIMHGSSVQCGESVYDIGSDDRATLRNVQNETPVDAGMRVSEAESGGVVDSGGWLELPSSLRRSE